MRMYMYIRKLMALYILHSVIMPKKLSARNIPTILHCL